MSDAQKARKPRRILDSDGTEVRAGCRVHFSYGIPPVGVDAEVIDRDGKLIVLTPGHNPAEAPLKDLGKLVGEFYVR